MCCRDSLIKLRTTFFNAMFLNAATVMVTRSQAVLGGGEGGAGTKNVQGIHVINADDEGGQGALSYFITSNTLRIFQSPHTTKCFNFRRTQE